MKTFQEGVSTLLMLAHDNVKEHPLTWALAIWLIIPAIVMAIVR